MFAYSVLMATKVFDSRYDVWVKNQGDIIKIFLTARNVNFSFILAGGCLFWHTLISYGVQIKVDISDHQ